MLKRILSNAFIHRMDPRGDYTFRLRTVKAASVRTLFDGIKEILTEANIEIDPLGIKIMAMDGTHTILVHMRLHADRFDEFHCPTKTIFGVNMMNLNKFLKGITSDDHLVMYQSRANQSKLNLIKLNGEKQMSTDMDLNLMELDIKPIEIPPVHFTSIITMPSSDFQKIIKELSPLGEKVEIKSVEHELNFRLEGGEFGNVSTTCVMPHASPEIVQGYFGLKQLALFTKLTPLSTDITLHLKNNYPIIIEYSVAGLGEVKLALAPSPRNDSGLSHS